MLNPMATKKCIHCGIGNLEPGVRKIHWPYNTSSGITFCNCPAGEVALKRHKLKSLLTQPNKDLTW